MNRGSHVAAALVATLGAACATPLLSPGEPRVVDGLTIAPYATHEQCVNVEAGDRLDYRYESSAPIDFDIRYREDGAVVSPIVRQHLTRDSGIFAVQIPGRHCVDWQAGPDGATVGYTLLLRRGP